VIGLPAGLFYGTGIPACVLVMRQRQGSRSGKPAERQGKVLFINADREYFEGRAQNHLLPEYIEKIVNTLETFAVEPGFSAIVANSTLAENDCYLNIRRYADNAPPPEPHDVRAHETICSIPTAIPPIAEQRAILKVCRAHEYRIGHEMAGLEKLRALKSGLMDDLLTGRVRVTPLLADASTL
jgi:N-6 DNA Methylase